MSMFGDANITFDAGRVVRFVAALFLIVRGEHNRPEAVLYVKTLWKDVDE